MRCSRCGCDNPEGAVICENCGFPFAKAKKSADRTIPKPPPRDSEAEAEKQKAATGKHNTSRILLLILAWIVGLAVLGIGIYKLVYWIEDYKITRLYTRGAYTPVVNETVMADGRQGHALVFYGEDGDKIYLPERDICLNICGGVARLAVADADWFENAGGNFTYADITFTPILVRENSSEIRLPVINYRVEAPNAPLEVVSPASNDLRVNTSTYPLELQVVPGSSVYINGEDISDRVDRGGHISGNLKVKPIGDNVYTIVVRTTNHKETRYDVTIYRAHYDIEIELDSEVSHKTTETTTVVSGTVEPGATITVDTAYIPESYQLDMETGRFSFIAKIEALGDNTIRFHASKQGRQDASLSLTVNYKPTLAQYSGKAWKMDYEQLRKYFENWTGRIFLCEGPVLDTFEVDGVEYFVMDVNPNGEQQLCILQNYSDSHPTIGVKHVVYADVTGRYYYKDNYYPMLAARYIDILVSR